MEFGKNSYPQLGHLIMLQLPAMGHPLQDEVSPCLNLLPQRGHWLIIIHLQIY